jgi:hypothetical protein
MFRMIPSANSDYLLKQHYPVDFVLETGSVFFEVRTECSNSIYINFLLQRVNVLKLGHANIV